jgi:hypothetical protein
MMPKRRRPHQRLAHHLVRRAAARHQPDPERERPDRHHCEDDHRIAQPRLAKGKERERQADVAGVAEDQRRQIGPPLQPGGGNEAPEQHRQRAIGHDRRQRDGGQRLRRDLCLHQRAEDQAGRGQRHRHPADELEPVLQAQLDPAETDRRQQENRRHDFCHRQEQPHSRHPCSPACRMDKPKRAQ